MAKYRIISPKIWNDVKFKGLSDNGKLVFFMLLTHPHTTSIGTLRAFSQGLAAELNWTEKAFREAFREAFQKGMVKVDEKAGLIWLPNFIKYNQPQSPNVIKSWVGALDDCPECSLKNEVFQSIKRLSESLSKAFHKAFIEAFGKTMANQEQEQDQDQEQDQNIINNLNTISSEQKDCSEQPEALQGEIINPEQEIFIKLPLIDGSEFSVTKERLKFWSECFPAANIEQEFRTMKAWLFAHEKRRKTKGGINRFIQGWLAKAQDNPKFSMQKTSNGNNYNNANKTQHVIDEQSRIMREIIEEDLQKQGEYHG